MTRILTPLVSAIALFAAAPAFAQDHSMHGMPGMAPPGEVPPAQEKKKDKAAARPRAQTPAPDATSAMDHSQHQASPAPQGDAAGQPQPASPAMPDMPGMDHSQHQDGAMPDMPGMDHSQHGQTAMPGMQMTGTALPAGNAPRRLPQRPLRRS
jgi:copper resistance protein B